MEKSSYFCWFKSFLTTMHTTRFTISLQRWLKLSLCFVFELIVTIQSKSQLWWKILPQRWHQASLRIVRLSQGEQVVWSVWTPQEIPKSIEQRNSEYVANSVKNEMHCADLNNCQLEVFRGGDWYLESHPQNHRFWSLCGAQFFG